MAPRIRAFTWSCHSGGRSAALNSGSRSRFSCATTFFNRLRLRSTSASELITEESPDSPPITLSKSVTRSSLVSSITTDLAV